MLLDHPLQHCIEHCRVEVPRSGGPGRARRLRRPRPGHLRSPRQALGPVPHRSGTGRLPQSGYLHERVARPPKLWHNGRGVQDRRGRTRFQRSAGEPSGASASCPGRRLAPAATRAPRRAPRSAVQRQQTRAGAGPGRRRLRGTARRGLQQGAAGPAKGAAAPTGPCAGRGGAPGHPREPRQGRRRAARLKLWWAGGRGPDLRGGRARCPARRRDGPASLRRGGGTRGAGA
mmetsp:Transcript_50413/g.155904  ORF Transcript_50413/g.155904 Transcript_50413/m.155904 type:complete len:231 (+) Transcript_50413:332-1024(+)